jgi:hypothetical protein
MGDKRKDLISGHFEDNIESNMSAGRGPLWICLKIKGNGEFWLTVLKRQIMVFENVHYYHSGGQ